MNFLGKTPYMCMNWELIESWGFQWNVNMHREHLWLLCPADISYTDRHDLFIFLKETLKYRAWSLDILKIVKNI